MKGIKYTILNHGTIENDMAWNTAMPVTGTVDNKYPKGKWLIAPSYSVLIEHPSEGLILYDTGSYLGDEGKGERKGEGFDQLFHQEIERNQFLDKQLELLSYTVEDINVVLLSHMHWDHSGGLGFFTKKSTPQRVVTGREDFQNGLVEVFKTERPTLGCPYFKKNYMFGNLEFELIEKDIEFCEGIDLILLPGHTPGVMGLILHTSNGVVIFPSDSCVCALNFGPPVRMPGILYDSIGYRKSVEKLRCLQKDNKAKIIYPHDIDQFNSLKHAPYFYE
ncbi:N-acyl homoserine lactonase family protein [Clostridium sp. LBM24168]